MIKVFYPENEILKRWIKYFYQQTNPTAQQRFVVFPNIGSAITIYENAQFSKIAEQQFVAKEANNLQAVLHLMRTDPVEITDIGILKKISIVFKPLGINQFIKTNLQELFDGHDRSYVPINLKGLTSDPASIEKMLLDNYVSFSNPVMEQAVMALSDVHRAAGIPELCRKLNTSVRSLNRLFSQHLCISPVQFRNICQFRHSLQLKLADKKTGLYDLAQESNVYDEAYLIKMYRKFTGLNPKKFFGNIKVDADSNYVYWLV